MDGQRGLPLVDILLLDGKKTVLAMRGCKRQGIVSHTPIDPETR